MTTFTPVSNLELKLRDVLTNRNTPLWSFYTPLAAAPLWIIVRHYPELDGSDLVAPPGKNPEVCVFEYPQGSYIGLYTAPARAQEAFQKFEVPPREMTIVSAPGYQLLKLLHDSESHLFINLGLPECQYSLDPDMVEILLSRTEPKYEPAAERKIRLEPTAEVESHLASLHEFLSRQPKVRAAWIYCPKPAVPLPAGQSAYELSLVMEDPEDKSLLHEVEVRAKALTPVEMEWTVGVMMGDEASLRNLAQQKPPFYARPDFLKPSAV